MEVLTQVNALAYLALAVVVGLRARRTGQDALERLSLYLLVIAGVTSGAVLASSQVPLPGVVALLFAMVLYPVALLRFGAAVARSGRGLERMAMGVLFVQGLVVIGAAIASRGQPSFSLALLLGAGFALVAHVVVAITLVQQVRRLRSRFLRRRATLLAAAAVVLGTSFAVGILGVRTDWGATVALVGGVAAAVLLAVATAPPRWLQAAFVLRDHDAVMVAEQELLTGDSAASGLQHMLEALRDLVGGEAGWYQVDGEVVAVVGDREAVAAAVRPCAGDGAYHADLADDSETWVLTATAGGGCLGLSTGGDPILYGLDVSDLVPRTARRIAVALRAREAEDRRREQERAEQEAAHFREVAELKDDLLSTINHELRTPLVLVTGGLELLAQRWEALGDDQRRELVEAADDHAGQLKGVVDQVLALADLRSGSTQPRPARIDLSDTVVAAVDGLEHDGRLELAGCSGSATTDAVLFGRTVRELVSNALRHTDGAVTVSAGVVDGHAEVQVLDRGDGLDEALLGAMARGGHYLHRTTRGLGLGLTLATETMELLGGELHVAAGDAGTIATCRVPVGDDPGDDA